MLWLIVTVGSSVCVYVYNIMCMCDVVICTCEYACVRVCTCICEYAYVLCMYVSMHVCDIRSWILGYAFFGSSWLLRMCVCACIYANKYLRMHASIHINVHTYKCSTTHICKCVAELVPHI